MPFPSVLFRALLSWKKFLFTPQIYRKIVDVWFDILYRPTAGAEIKILNTQCQIDDFLLGWFTFAEVQTVLGQNSTWWSSRKWEAWRQQNMGMYEGLTIPLEILLKLFSINIRTHNYVLGGQLLTNCSTTWEFLLHSIRYFIVKT